MKRYSPIPTTKSPDGNQMYKTARYPEVPRTQEDTYVYTTAGDRFDTLAQQYYGDSTLWWIISIANGNLNQNSLTPPIGSQIRIPSNPTPIIAEYEIINN
jgi:hypothetical protein|tara:strand:+ start:451 stop:750 length:300 start_codon:yes stop_codon:yes gene_type:complete